LPEVRVEGVAEILVGCPQNESARSGGLEAGGLLRPIIATAATDESTAGALQLTTTPPPGLL